MASITDWLFKLISNWLLDNDPSRRAYLSDFDQICKEIKIGDVILIEGRNRASRIIQQISRSPWSHAALYIGELSQVTDKDLREKVKEYGAFTAAGPLIIESEVGVGTIVAPLKKYKEDHIRILRPQGLSLEDREKVVEYAIGSLGKNYSVRHLLDLARFVFPWGLFPKRWRSSLFMANALQPTQDICSSMIGNAFYSIHYPILPIIQEDFDRDVELLQRNPRLLTPSDFDYSPYFDIIKYPIIKLSPGTSPSELPWKHESLNPNKKSMPKTSDER